LDQSIWRRTSRC